MNQLDLLEVRQSRELSCEADVQRLVRAGAWFVVSHSGGKDSQAMYAAIRRLVPDSQIVVVHADLGNVEWSGTQDHIRANIAHELHVVHAIDKLGKRKHLLDLVEQRAADRPDTPAWPSSQQRWCTSDLKRTPLEKFTRSWLERHRAYLVVSCMGLRAEESPARAKRPALVKSERNSRAGREWYEWLPIQHWSTADVFAEIRDAGQQPHYAYALGNERLSCVFCIFGSDNDLNNGARARPELAARYIELERRIGRSMYHRGVTLASRIKSECK